MREGKSDGLLLLQQRRCRCPHAIKAHGLERVAIIDFDVHHGNGTEIASPVTSAC
jgi:hypothetical protein